VNVVRAKVVATTGRYKSALYAGTSSQPGGLLSQTEEVVNPATGWQTFPLSSSLTLTNGAYYWLAIWSDSSGGRVYHSGSTGTLRWGRYDYGNWPNPISTSGGGNYNYCIYAVGTNVAASMTLAQPVAPWIESLIVTSGVANLRWTTIPDRFYRVQYLEDLNGTNWLDLEPDLKATDATLMQTNWLDGQPMRFYRVILLP